MQETKILQLSSRGTSNLSRMFIAYIPEEHKVFINSLDHEEIRRTYEEAMEKRYGEMQ